MRVCKMKYVDTTNIFKSGDFSNYTQFRPNTVRNQTGYRQSRKMRDIPHELFEEHFDIQKLDFNLDLETDAYKTPKHKYRTYDGRYKLKQVKIHFLI